MYNCPEKNATFAPDGVTPSQMPDLSKHSHAMAARSPAKAWGS